METITIYRGIRVSAADAANIISRIQKKGLVIDEEYEWSQYIVKDLKPELETLYANPKLTTKETKPHSILFKYAGGESRKYVEGGPCICFVDRLGAEYYALEHDQQEEVKTVSLLITATVNIDDVTVEGRDFLYTMFNALNAQAPEKLKRQTDALILLYGIGIERYIYKALHEPESQRIAICDLAVSDRAVIRHHAQNQHIIGGRYNTVFRSAFMVKAPILPEQIDAVEDLQKKPIPKSEISLRVVL